MKDSIQSGFKAANEAKNAFETISFNISDTFDKSTEIEESTKSQNHSINESISSMEKIVIVSEQTAAGTEELSAATGVLDQGIENISDTGVILDKMSKELFKVVSNLKN